VWLRQIQRDSAAEQQQAEVALRGLGTNSIPFLLGWLESHDSPLKKMYYEMLPRRKLIQSPPEWAFDQQWMAASAFGVLGTNANAAVPKLSRLLGDGKRGRAAAAALSGIGPAAVPVLTNLVFQPQTAQDAAYGLTRFGDEALAVLLVAALSTNRSVHVAALSGLHFCIFDSYLWLEPDLGRRALQSSMKYNTACISVAMSAYSGRETMLVSQILEKCESSTNQAVAAVALATRRKLGP
jgi:HEAT repeat protein